MIQHKIRPVKLYGVTYYIDTMTNIIVDIDVAPGVKKVCFSMEIMDYNIDDIKIYYSGKSFPDVENLVIGKDVCDLMLPNELFPNVTHVTSKSEHFVDNTNVLICHTELLNAFCNNKVIDLKNVTSIRANAFKGSQACSIINTNDISINEIRRSGYNAIDETTGCIVFGDVLLGINQDAETIEIPDDRFELKRYEDFSFTSENECIKIHHCDTLSSLDLMNIPEHIILDSKEGIENIIDILSEVNCSYLEIIGDNKIYTTIDGILYTKDKKILLKCPNLKSGEITIPDGVETIADSAFFDCNIQSVSMPETLRCIGYGAFKYCSDLRSVKFNDELEYIDESAFLGCKNLKDIKIPSGITYISKNCFSSCPLEYIDFPKSLRVIDISAFDSAICSVSLPKSVRRVWNDNFTSVKSITIDGDIVPYGLIYSLMIPSPGVNVVTLKTSKGILYIPKSPKSCNHDYLSSIEEINLYIIQHLKQVPSSKKTREVVLEMYEKVEDAVMLTEIGNILKEISKDMIKDMIKDNDEKGLIRLIKTGILSSDELNELSGVVKAATISAYILEQLNKLNPGNVLDL